MKAGFSLSSGPRCGTQAWSEWLADAGGVFKMTDWTGKNMVKQGGHKLPDFLRGLVDKFGAGMGRTKTASLAIDRTLGDVRIGQGFDEMYRHARASGADSSTACCRQRQCQSMTQPLMLTKMAMSCLCSCEAVHHPFCGHYVEQQQQRVCAGKLAYQHLQCCSGDAGASR